LITTKKKVTSNIILPFGVGFPAVTKAKTLTKRVWFLFGRWGGHSGPSPDALVVIFLSLFWQRESWPGCRRRRKNQSVDDRAEERCVEAVQPGREDPNRVRPLQEREIPVSYIIVLSMLLFRFN